MNDEKNGKKKTVINELSEKEFKEFLAGVKLNGGQLGLVGDLLISVNVLEHLKTIIFELDEIKDIMEPAIKANHESINRLGMYEIYKDFNPQIVKAAKRFDNLIQAVMDTLSGEAEKNVKNGKFKIFTSEKHAKEQQKKDGNDYLTI